jgi:acetyl esterase/lipase
LRGWLATFVLAVMVVVLGLVLLYMVRPVGLGGLGTFGSAGFGFSITFLYLLVVTVGLGYLARRRGALLPLTLAAVGTVLVLVIALWPTIALARWAGDHHVDVSVISALQAKPNPTSIRADSVTYTTTPDGTALHLDVWRAARRDGTSPGPALLHVHGGGWNGGTRGETSRWDREMARRGFQVFDVEYRLAPAASLTDEVADVKCALGWIAEHAGTYAVDTRRISVMGGSAGGHLAMLAAYSSGDPALPPSCDVPAVAVRSVVNLYGPGDLTDLYRHSGSRGALVASVRQYLGGTPDQHPGTYEQLSPITHVSAASPPTLTVSGRSDRVVPTGQLHELHRVLAAAGVAEELFLLPATDHGFDQNWTALSTQIARRLIPAFLARYG